jgi:hypothetical protein
VTPKRFVGTVAAAFFVSQVLTIAIHGFILASDYAPFYGNLLRPMSNEGSWQMLLLPLSHLFFVTALVWVSSRVIAGLEGSTLVRGLKIGVLGWVIGQAPLWMLWYAEQPWPGSLVAKQLPLELVSSLLVGVTIAIVARKADPSPRS